MNSNRARTFTTSVYMLKGLLWKLSVSYYSQYLTQRNNPCGLTCPIKTSLISTVCFSCWQHKWCHPSQKSFNRNRRVKVKRKTVELFRHFQKSPLVPDRLLQGLFNTLAHNCGTHFQMISCAMVSFNLWRHNKQSLSLKTGKDSLFLRRLLLDAKFMVSIKVSSNS